MTSFFQSTQYPSELDVWVATGVVQRRDLRAVASLVSLAGGPPPDPLAWIAMALVIATPRSGHTCVDFEHIAMWGPAESAVDPPKWPVDADMWMSAVVACPDLVCGPDDIHIPPRRPFVLDGSRLYAARSFDEERRVAVQLRTAVTEGRLRIITGGPGSGKTFTLAAALVEDIERRVRAGEAHLVALAAPTGLAAKRMARAIRAAVRNATPGADIEKAIDALPKVTVHRLLRFNPASKIQWRYNSDTRMPYDTVIIDEVSMMPLSMMARVLDAMKRDAHLTLVGDPNQLASVDAGTVLADIVEASRRGQGFVENLPGSRRFPAGSPVGDIAKATNEGKIAAVMAAIGVHTAKDDDRFAWVDPVASPLALNDVARLVVDHARTLCEMAAVATEPDKYRQVIAYRDALQVVCAHRRGNLGVSGWNKAVERQLGPLARGQWYLGRPVMVTRNDGLTGLSNGDIGVVCPDGRNGRVVVFGDAEDITVLPVSKVPHVETVHALTIHKSQGSEYDHTVVVLPKRSSRILTRELLYTGMTRAKPRLTLVATPEALKHAVETPVQRATGLARLL